MHGKHTAEYTFCPELHSTIESIELNEEFIEWNRIKQNPIDLNGME